MGNIRIERAVMAMVDAIENAARERAQYLLDPHPRKADRDDFLKMIDKRRDDVVKGARVALDTEFDRIAKDYQRARKTSFDDNAVTAAWEHAVKPLLDTLHDVDYIAALPGFTRDQAEAIRRFLPAHEASQFPEARPQDIERRVRPALYTVLRREIALMDRDEAEATQAEFERLAAADTVKAVDKMAVEAQQSGRVSGQAMLAVGYAQKAAGIAPPPESWRSIVSRISPLDLANAQFNTLDPETRSRVIDEAKRQGFESSEPAEPSLRVER
jgi:hypothetical protein